MKSTTYYHRSYKTLTGPAWSGVLGLVLVACLLDLVLIRFHPEILHRLVSLAQIILDRCGIPGEVAVWPFLPPLFPALPVVDTPCVFPGQQVALLNFVGGVLVVAVVPRLRFVPRPLVVYLVFLGLLDATSAGFFSLVPHLFPYDIPEFSLLYLGVELGIWLLLPFLLAATLAPLPAGTGEKILVVLLTLGYSILFGTVRYAAFLLFLHELSILHMATVFFALGPLLDFVYVVTVYSLYLNLIAVRLKRRPETWRWLFSS